jgi:hypothetical protein
MACPTCDELDQHLMILRSRIQKAEDPSMRNTLEQEEAALVRKLSAHTAICEDKKNTIR